MNDVLRPMLTYEDRHAAMSFGLAKLTDASLLAVIVAQVFPETIFGTIYFSVLPLDYVFLYLVIFFLFLEWVVWATRPPWIAVLALGAALLMTLVGIHMEHRTRHVVKEASKFCGLIAGSIWATRRPLDVVVDRLRQWTLVVGFLAVLAIAGIGLGFMAPSRPGTSRSYVYSMFWSCRLLAVMCPFLFCVGLNARDPACRRRFLWAALASAGIVLATGILAAKRALFLASVAILLLFLRIGTSRRRGVVVASLLILFSLLGLLTYHVYRPSRYDRAARRASVVYDVYLLEERLEGTSIERETRYLEIQHMLDQVDWRLPFGTGFGSHYRTYGTTVGKIAFEPHVGALSFLLKGGWVLFVLCVVLPAVASLWFLFLGTDENLRLASWGCVLMYLFTSSMSGGWAIFQLFLYGIFLTLAVSRRPLEIDRCAS